MTAISSCGAPQERGIFEADFCGNASENFCLGGPHQPEDDRHEAERISIRF
jgi:hypothetical protein